MRDKFRKLGEDEKLVYNDSLLEGFEPIYEYNDIYSNNQSISHAPERNPDKLSELERKNRILARAKESLFKKNAYNKVKLEKKIEKLNAENAKLLQQLHEKEKELK